MFNMSNLLLRSLDNVSANRLAREITLVREMILKRKKLRGRLPKGMLAELQEYFEWGFSAERTLRERLGMAKAKNEPTTWRGFVDVKLTDEEKQHFSEWDVHDNDLFLLLSEAVSTGHKFSLTFNTKNDTFVCSFTGNEGTGKHEGYTLSAFASDWYVATRVLVYKHAVLLENDWARAADRPSDNIG